MLMVIRVLSLCMKTSAEIDKDLKRVYSESVEGQNPHNLALFLDSYYR